MAISTQPENTAKAFFARDSRIAERYTVIAKLGAGRTGVVYEVSDDQLDGERVALKILYPHLLQDQSAVDRVRKEVFLVRQLSHPNVVRIYDIELFHAEYQYITMELVHGYSLRYILDELGRSFTEAEVRSVISQLLLGLRVAHEKGIVHRDIKPENVLIDYSGILKVSDFGCFHTAENERLTKTGQLVGTPAYMAPEQFSINEVSTATDMYSVGILAYELITGRVPFKDETLYGLAKSHASVAPKIDELPKSYSPTVLSFVDQALIKLAQERIANAQEGLDVLAVSDASKQALVLEELMTKHFSDARESVSSRRRSRFSEGILYLLAIFCWLLLATSETFQVTIYSDLLRIERYFDLDLPRLRAALGFPDLDLRKSNTIHDAVENERFREIKMWCVAGIMSNPVGPDGVVLIDRFIRHPLLLRDTFDFDPGCLFPYLFDRAPGGRAKPVITAVKFGHVAALRTLVNAGYNVNVVDHDGRTALQLAIDSGNPELVNSLTATQFPTLRVNANSNEPLLFRAVRGGDLMMIEAILKLDTPLKQRNDLGQNSLMIASYSPLLVREKVVQRLIENGASCQAVDNKGKSVKSYFANTPTLKKLIEGCIEREERT